MTTRSGNNRQNQNWKGPDRLDQGPGGKWKCDGAKRIHECGNGYYRFNRKIVIRMCQRG